MSSTSIIQVAIDARFLQTLLEKVILLQGTLELTRKALVQSCELLQGLFEHRLLHDLLLIVVRDLGAQFVDVTHGPLQDPTLVLLTTWNHVRECVDAFVDRFSAATFNYKDVSM